MGEVRWVWWYEVSVFLHIMGELRRGGGSGMTTTVEECVRRTGLAYAFEIGAGRCWWWWRKGGRRLEVLKRQEMGSSAGCLCKECL